MRKLTIWLFMLLALPLALAASAQDVAGQTTFNLAACKEVAFSTEEDFITQGPLPADGNAVISDGDLLSGFNHVVCARNRQLLSRWDLNVDLGLDAVDVLDVDSNLVAFSTSLNHPNRSVFTAGDLLTTWGAVIPNQALLILFQIEGDRGLDAVHFVGSTADILKFNEAAANVAREVWLAEPGRLALELRRYGIDIWFSIEGTEMRAATVSILDGDLLSAAHGRIVASNDQLLPAFVPAGIPVRGVDFGLDAFSGSRDFNIDELKPREGHFSTEILYNGELSFTDGDILKMGNGIAIPGHDLYASFEPKADFLGTDAFYIFVEPSPQPILSPYFPVILREYLKGRLP